MKFTLLENEAHEELPNWEDLHKPAIESILNNPGLNLTPVNFEACKQQRSHKVGVHEYVLKYWIIDVSEEEPVAVMKLISITKVMIENVQIF